MKLEPADHCWTILQDSGPADGGWGPAAVLIPGVSVQPQPFVYTGADERAIAMLHDVARMLAQETGKPTRLVRYSSREDALVIGGSS